MCRETQPRVGRFARQSRGAPKAPGPLQTFTRSQRFDRAEFRGHQIKYRPPRGKKLPPGLFGHRRGETGRVVHGVNVGRDFDDTLWGLEIRSWDPQVRSNEF